MGVETLRMLERMLSVIIGGFSIYLGFYLFKIIPHVDTGEGKFTFPGGSIHLTRTGPGVFFALFGAVLVFSSFYFQIKFTPDYFAGAPIKDEPYTFIGLAPEERAKHQIWIQNLNRINNTISFETPSIEKGEVNSTINQIKLILIQQMLDNPKDPEFDDFKLKILSNPNQKFGEKWQKWADIYNKQ